MCECDANRQIVECARGSAHNTTPACFACARLGERVQNRCVLFFLCELERRLAAAGLDLFCICPLAQSPLHKLDLARFHCQVKGGGARLGSCRDLESVGGNHFGHLDRVADGGPMSGRGEWKRTRHGFAIERLLATVHIKTKINQVARTVLFGPCRRPNLDPRRV